MVGLSDIPIVGKIVDRISDATVEAMFRGLKYVFFYKALVKDLDSEIGKLNIEMERVSRKVEEERDNGKIIYDDVLTWQKKVEEIQKPPREFSPSWTCIHCLPIPNPVSRFRLGKEAVVKAKFVTELTGSGKEFLNKDVAHLAPVDNVPKSDAAFQNFESRNNAYEKLWQELVNEDGPLILGIYGMPGVGKTRMMEQIWTEAKEKNIFNKITRADVSSEKLDVINLQTQIASHLDCDLVSKDDAKRRADQLKMSIINGGKVLVVLDDVWREIPLIDIIGTSFGDDSTVKGCKILMTSRKRDVCLRNKCKNPVEITSLRHDEALYLFKNTVGNFQNDSLPDESLVQEVCTKCAGLPLLICAVGKALRFATHHVWKDALYKLNNCKIESVPGIEAEVYACLKLSFDNLTKDAQLCLLLCSLFPEDANISTTILIRLAVGSQLVHGESIPAMVDILKASSLLLENKYDAQFKMHDIIRDMARYIAVTEAKYAFSFARCGSRLPENAADYGDRKLLYLELENTDFRFPDDLVCPDVHTLSLLSMATLSYEDPMDDIRACVTKLSSGMFVNLRFLALARFGWQWQSYIQPLGNLRTLFLNNCMLKCSVQTDVSSIFPEKLESLSIWMCHLWDPLNLSNLKYLRKLEIMVDEEDNNLVFLPNTISSLSSLEELHIPHGVRGYDAMPEISKLTRLTSLQFTFRHFEPLCDTTIFRNLLKYNILVGCGSEDYAFPLTVQRSINLSIDKLVGFESLIARAQELTLQNVQASNIWIRNKEEFACLRRLNAENCLNMEYLVRMLHDEIQHSPGLQTSFSELTILSINRCSAMKYLFNNSVANCLVQLQELSVSRCEMMEVIVMGEGTCDAVMINFSKLKSLFLDSLPRLRGFYKENKYMHSSSGSIGINNNSAIPSVESQSLFDGMVTFPSLEVLGLNNLEDTSNIWGKYNYDDDVSSFSNLKSLGVSSCQKLEILIPLAMLHRLQKLEVLQIDNCSSLISEVGAHGSNSAACSLVALHDMTLTQLPSLTKTGLNSSDHFGEITLYPNLRKLIIDDCGSLRNVFLPSTAGNSMHLKEMYVNTCEMMREIIGAGNHERPDGIAFPELTILQLDNLPNLTCFWCDQSGEANIYKVEFPNLVDLTIHYVDISLKGIALGRGDSTCKLNSLYICSKHEIQLPCRWKPRSLNLESLKLEYCWSHELHRCLSFQRIKVLTLREQKCSTLFTSSVFSSLQQLEELKISNCPSLEEIVKDAKDDEVSGMNNRATLFQLKSIILEDLPNLKSFMHSANCEVHLPAIKKIRVHSCGLSTLFLRCFFGSLQQLENLEVSNCGLLECIFEDARGDETSDTDGKIITLFRLSKIYLRDLQNLKSFIHSANYECLLPAIKVMRLDGCGLSTLFSRRAFENLQRLQSLSISNCRWLECIVEDARGDETSDKNEKVITLFLLSGVYLEELPNLKSFSRTTRLALEMPELQSCILEECPRVENRTIMARKKEGCVAVFTEWLNGKETDLNDYIIQYVSESESTDSAGESGDSDHELETKSESAEEDEQPQYSEQETET